MCNVIQRTKLNSEGIKTKFPTLTSKIKLTISKNQRNFLKKSQKSDLRSNLDKTNLFCFVIFQIFLARKLKKCLNF